MGKQVIVIGAGISGLSAASYLQRNGFDTEIFELHTRPGGVCTSWTRKGYTFDGCIHWLMGSGKASNLNWIWKELGAGELEYIEWDIYATARLSDGDIFTVYTDPDRLCEEMLRLGPEDGEPIRLLTSLVRKAKGFDMPSAIDRASFLEKIRLAAMFPSLRPYMSKWMKKPLFDIVSKFKSPKLREAFDVFLGNVSKVFPAGAFGFMLGFMAKKTCGYPIGGSKAFAEAIESKYLSLGGKIRYGAKVDEILVEDGKAAGVRSGGKEYRSDIVVSAADGYDTTRRLLGGRYSNPDLEAAFEKLSRYPSLIFVSLGIAADYSKEAYTRVFKLKEPLVLEDGALKKDRLSVRFFSFDPTSAPAGKTAAVVMIDTRNDEFWSRLRAEDQEAYKERKDECARKVIDALDAEYPGLKSKLETIDVATPATYIRYTNNWHGSYEGWEPSGSSLTKKMAKTFPGLENFHIVGQWVNPGGGLPPAGTDGRNLAKSLCKKEGRRFRAE